MREATWYCNLWSLFLQFISSRFRCQLDIFWKNYYINIIIITNILAIIIIKMKLISIIILPCNYSHKYQTFFCQRSKYTKPLFNIICNSTKEFINYEQYLIINRWSIKKCYVVVKFTIYSSVASIEFRIFEEIIKTWVQYIRTKALYMTKGAAKLHYTEFPL